VKVSVYALDLPSLLQRNRRAGQSSPTEQRKATRHARPDVGNDTLLRLAEPRAPPLRAGSREASYGITTVVLKGRTKNGPKTVV
jgi:hypothetical protein